MQTTASGCRLLLGGVVHSFFHKHDTDSYNGQMSLGGQGMVSRALVFCLLLNLTIEFKHYTHCLF